MLKDIFSAPVLQNSIKISLIVGTIINLINQGPGLLEDGSISFPKLLLNYFVPFAVSSYSAAKIRKSDRESDT